MATKGHAPLIARKVEKETKTLTVHLEQSVHDRLTKYCEFLGGQSIGVVVEGALTYLMNADKAFREHEQPEKAKASKAAAK